MSDQSGPSQFQALFEAAFRDYEIQTGKTLANHPLAAELQNCDSVESVSVVLRKQIVTSGEIRGKDKILKPLKNVLLVLHNLPTNSDLGLLLPHVKAIQTGIGILLSAVKGVLDDYDTLTDLLESVEQFLNRLDIYTKLAPTESRSGIIVKILVELLSILALATKQLQQGKLKALVKKKLGGKDIEAVLQRLDRLTKDEAQLTAAETLKVVHGLFQNMKHVVDGGKSSIDRVRNGLETIQQLASEINKSKRDKLKQDIKNWLSPPDPWKNQNIACKSRHPKSAAWFLQGDTYSEWKASRAPGSLLWVHGKPGAGKSVFCSAIVDDIDAMRKAGLASLAFFYCDFREDQKTGLRGLLSSLLVQLYHQSDSYCDELSQLYSEYADGSRYPSDDALAGFLKNVLKLPGHAPVYLILDALDECSNTSSIPSPRSDVLNLIEKLIKSKISNLHICVTSRPEVDIKDALDPLIFRSVSLHEECGQKDDIEEYIASVINTDPKNKRWRAKDKRLVIEVLTNKAQGMFRWVYCQLVYICGCIPQRIEHALADLPETLDETYQRTLREINEADWEFAHRIFQVVAVAVRPLLVKELAELLAFDFDTGPIPKFREDWRPGDPINALLSTCHSFLVIIEDYHERKVVQFSHFSVKEFLTSTRLAKANDIILDRYHISETLAPAHTLIARVCLGYLLHLDKNVTNYSLRKLHFTEYSAKYWVDHARHEDVSRNVEDGLKKLFHPSKPHLRVCAWIRDRDPSSLFRRGHQNDGPPPLRGTPLHYAASWDLHSIVEFLIDEHSQNVNSQDFTDSATPLHVASDKGHMKVARRLLEYHADVEIQNTDKETPLHVASKRGQTEVARMLIEHHGANISAQNKDGQTPLHLASQAGKPEVAQMLIERGAGVSAQDKDGKTPLHLVILRDWRYMDTSSLEEVARILIERVEDVSAQDGYGRTPLHLASKARRLKIARMLIERGANMLAQNKYGQTPLHEASEHGQLEGASMLIERGVDASAQDRDGLTPLHLASRAGRLEVARMLIERGVDVSAQDRDGRTPLHLASRAGRLEVARMLIERSVDVSAQDKDGQTPLHLASQAGQLEVVQMLIERRASVSAADNDGQTPLHVALQEEQQNVVRMLIERGASVLSQNKDGQTPLHLASKNEKLEVVRMLIERCAGVSAPDKDGQTPLHVALKAEQQDVVRMLIECGTDVSAQDKNGQTPLHLVSIAGKLEVVKILIERCAGVSVPNNDGQTPLHVALLAGQQDVVYMLIERGASVLSQNKDGQTPLHLASKRGKLEVVRKLIDRCAGVSTPDNDGQTPLHVAFHATQLDVVQMLIERGADVSAQDKNGQTPLHLASLMGVLEISRMLIKRGAKGSTQNKDGRTALHMVFRGNWDQYIETHCPQFIRMFIECGADVSAQDKDGQTPLHMASQVGGLECVRALIGCSADVSAQNKNGQTPLHLAILEYWTADRDTSHQQIAHLLIERGADVSAQDNDGQTPLHLVSQAGPRDIAHSLIERGASVSAKDKVGQTPLHLASQAGPLDVVGVLIERGANVSAQDKDGQTPLHHVILNYWDPDPDTPNDQEVARMLIEHGADLSARDKDGQTPLHLASQAGPSDIVRMLIEHGADLSAQDENGQTPLHLVILGYWDPCLDAASASGYQEVTRMLIEHGADMSVRDNGGRTPLLLASASQVGPPVIVRMLIEHGADVSLQDKDGWIVFMEVGFMLALSLFPLFVSILSVLAHFF